MRRAGTTPQLRSTGFSLQYLDLSGCGTGSRALEHAGFRSCAPRLQSAGSVVVVPRQYLDLSGCGTGSQALEHAGFSSCAPRLQSTGSVVVVPGFHCSVAVASARTKDRTSVPCKGGRCISTVSPGKSSLYHFNFILLLFSFRLD